MEPVQLPSKRMEPHLDEPHLESAGAEEAWRCPICVDLLYKPCVNTTCGHVFCFWCFHHSMNGFQKSACPLCRAPYSHFPKVCTQLHFFLQSQFPEAYERRHRENQEYEQKRKVHSPDIPSLSEVQDASPVDAGSPALLSPLRAAPPAAVVTSPAAAGAAAPAASDKGGQGVGVGQQQEEQQQVLHRRTNGPAADSGSRAGGADTGDAAEQAVASPTGGTSFSPYALAGLSLQDFACKNPGCGGQLAFEPAVLSCGHLVCHTCRPHDFPGPAASSADSDAAAAAASSSSASTAPPAEAQPRGSPHCPHCMLPVLPGAGRCGLLDDAIRYMFPKEREHRGRQVREQQAAAAAAGAAGPSPPAGAPFSRATAGQRPRAASKIPGLDQRLASCKSRAAAWRMAWREMAANADVAYTWFAIGCDCCGVFPIQGRRYRCRDCPDSIGFDLCGPCHDLGWAGGRGRFNQVHTAQHQLVKVEPEFLIRYAQAQQHRRRRRGGQGEGQQAEGQQGVQELMEEEERQRMLQQLMEEQVLQEQEQREQAEERQHARQQERAAGSLTPAEAERQAAAEREQLEQERQEREVLRRLLLETQQRQQAQAAAPPQQPQPAAAAPPPSAATSSGASAPPPQRQPAAAAAAAAGAAAPSSPRLAVTPLPDALAAAPPHEYELSWHPPGEDDDDDDEVAMNESIAWVDQQSQAVMAVVNVLEALHPELRVEDAMRLAWMEWGAASLEQLAMGETGDEEGEEDEEDEEEPGGAGREDGDEEGGEAGGQGSAGGVGGRARESVGDAEGQGAFGAEVGRERAASGSRAERQPLQGAAAGQQRGQGRRRGLPCVVQ